MKAIMVMFDTLNRRMLPPFGCDWIHAPNFERLAKRTVTFDCCFGGSMPCMPARREIHTGRYNFLHRSWGPLEPFDDSMPEMLQRAGVYTHLTSDHYHYWEDGGATYHTRYSTWDFSRGQEGDPWIGRVSEPEIPPCHGNRKGRMWRQDWVNRKYIDREERMPQHGTFKSAENFIRANHSSDRWFLHVETFDPHEPFYTQKRWKKLYPHKYPGLHYDWPSYGPVTDDPETVQHVRCEYAALVSMCDHYLGRVLDLMDRYDMWKDTMLIVNTDHGWHLGEHGFWGKIWMPFYNEVIHSPLFVWDPRSRKRNEHRSALVQTIDLAPTLLELFGVDRTPDMEGAPLREAVRSDRRVHEAGLFGVHGGHVNCTDGRYVYMRAPAREENQPLFNYTVMPTHMRGMFSMEEMRTARLHPGFSFTKGSPVMKIAAKRWQGGGACRTMLFDLKSDPGENRPLDNPRVERRMSDYMVALMRANDSPPEQLVRLGLDRKVARRRPRKAT